MAHSEPDGLLSSVCNDRLMFDSGMTTVRPVHYALNDTGWPAVWKICEVIGKTMCKMGDGQCYVLTKCIEVISYNYQPNQKL